MALAICKTHCYFAEREFLVGEILEVGEEKIPTHFELFTGDDIRGKRIYRLPNVPKKPAEPTPADRAQSGEAVALSQLGGQTPPPQAPAPETKEDDLFS